jgi:hypothetical protein
MQHPRALVPGGDSFRKMTGSGAGSHPGEVRFDTLMPSASTSPGWAVSVVASEAGGQRDWPAKKGWAPIGRAMTAARTAPAGRRNGCS